MAAYEIAKAGGKHSGYLKNLEPNGVRQIAATVRSLDAQAAMHREKLTDPHRFVPDWFSRSQGYREGLLKKWAGEVAGFQEQAEIARRLLDERK